jgi:hypothetical protein
MIVKNYDTLEEVTGVSNEEITQPIESDAKKFYQDYLNFSQRFLLPFNTLDFKRNGGYITSSLYIGQETEPKIIITRNFAEFTGRAIGIADFIGFGANGKEFQYDFEIDEYGNMIMYPKKYDKLVGFIEEYTIASSQDGNRIISNIRSAGCYTSLGGHWIKTEEYNKKLLEAAREEIKPYPYQLPNLE